MRSKSLGSLIAGTVVAVVSLSCAIADPVAPADVYVVDGDTITVHGKRIRLVGFDAPELGGHARCGLERMLAARATSRLRQLVRTGGDLDLKLIPCSCRPGTEGTMACNYGRACGVLTVEGEDVGDVLMAHLHVLMRQVEPAPRVDPRLQACRYPFLTLLHH